MKKLVIVLVVFLLVAMAAFSINMGDFPKGSWLDQKYNAIWTFSADNIVLTYMDETPVYDFNGKIEDFKIVPGTDGLEMSFSCEETGRSYKFIKDLTTLSLKMIIDRVDGVHYEVVMPIQQ